MTLTLGTAPLGTQPGDERNYEIDGPAHRLLLTPFPRRVRATFGGETILDTTEGRLLHESNLLPALYVPEHDVRSDLLVSTDHTTHCPFKGDAVYHSLSSVDGQMSENATWSYPDPIVGAPWLSGTMSFYWDRVDAWFDEDERVHGHLRDPFHRVDVRRSGRHVRVLVGDDLIADTLRPMVLSENGLPNRWYIEPGDVDLATLDAGLTTTHCPYKGDASYWNLTLGSASVADVAFAYHQPFDDAVRIAGMMCFIPSDSITVEVDGERLTA